MFAVAIAISAVFAAGEAVAATPAPDLGPDLGPTLKGLLTHRGVYEMKLAGQKAGSDINKAEGRLVYEFTGSPCEGFSTQFRFVTRIESDGGEVKLSDMRTTSFEDGPGTSFDFLNQTYISSRLTEDSKGSAARKAEGIAVAMTKPKAATVQVASDAMFPTQRRRRATRSWRSSSMMAARLAARSI